MACRPSQGQRWGAYVRQHLKYDDGGVATPVKGSGSAVPPAPGPAWERGLNEQNVNEHWARCAARRAGATGSAAMSTATTKSSELGMSGLQWAAGDGFNLFCVCAVVLLFSMWMTGVPMYVKVLGYEIISTGASSSGKAPVCPRPNLVLRVLRAFLTDCMMGGAGAGRAVESDRAKSG